MTIMTKMTMMTMMTMMTLMTLMTMASRQLRDNNHMPVGWFLAIISGLLFTTNNFFVKLLEMDAAEVLLVRSALKTVVLGLLLSAPGAPSLLPSSWSDCIFTWLQGFCIFSIFCIFGLFLHFLAAGNLLRSATASPAGLPSLSATWRCTHPDLHRTTLDSGCFKARLGNSYWPLEVLLCTGSPHRHVPLYSTPISLWGQTRRGGSE